MALATIACAETPLALNLSNMNESAASFLEKIQCCHNIPSARFGFNYSPQDDFKAS